MARTCGTEESRIEQAPAEPEPDLELIEIVGAASRGDETAWRALTERFNGSLMAIARSCRLSDADAGEVQQTTWLRLVENIGRIEQPHRIGSWLATTAFRECLRLVRLRSRTTFDDELLDRLVDESLAPADARPLAEERAALVRRAFDELNPRCQRLLAFFSGEETISYKEISERLSMPIGSIGPTRGRCLEHLRRIMESLECEPEVTSPEASVDVGAVSVPAALPSWRCAAPAPPRSKGSRG